MEWASLGSAICRPMRDAPPRLSEAPVERHEAALDESIVKARESAGKSRKRHSTEICRLDDLLIA